MLAFRYKQQQQQQRPVPSQWSLTRVPTSSDSHRFRPQARAPPLGACLHHQRCGDGEVSGSGVSEGVSERPRPSQSGPRWWCRPTLNEGGSHALQVCQHLPPIRLCESATLSGCQRLKEHTLLATAPTESAETFTRSHSAHACALCDREGGGRWPVRPSSLAQNRVMGTNSTKPRTRAVAPLT